MPVKAADAVECRRSYLAVEGCRGRMASPTDDQGGSRPEVFEAVTCRHRTGLQLDGCGWVDGWDCGQSPVLLPASARLQSAQESPATSALAQRVRTGVFEDEDGSDPSGSIMFMA